MEYLTTASIAQLKDGEAVWFGNDVLRQMDRSSVKYFLWTTTS